MVKEIPLSKGKVTLVDDEDYLELSKHKWCTYKSSSTWYTHRRNGKTTQSLHRFILKIPKGLECDHINGDGLDNRRYNLRIVNKSQNMRNKKPCLKSSNFKGITRPPTRKKWVAQIKVNGIEHHLGNFKNEVDAAKAYDKATKKYFGEYARLNFPEEEEC